MVFRYEMCSSQWVNKYVPPSHTRTWHNRQVTSTYPQPCTSRHWTCILFSRNGRNIDPRSSAFRIPVQKKWSINNSVINNGPVSNPVHTIKSHPTATTSLVRYQWLKTKLSLQIGQLRDGQSNNTVWVAVSVLRRPSLINHILEIDL